MALLQLSFRSFNFLKLGVLLAITCRVNAIVLNKRKLRSYAIFLVIAGNACAYCFFFLFQNLLELPLLQLLLVSSLGLCQTLAFASVSLFLFIRIVCLFHDVCNFVLNQFLDVVAIDRGLRLYFFRLLLLLLGFFKLNFLCCYRLFLLWFSSFDKLLLLQFGFFDRLLFLWFILARFIIKLFRGDLCFNNRNGFLFIF